MKTQVVRGGFSFVLATVALAAHAENWPQFRGDAGGVAAEAKLPVAWGADNHIAWKAKLPGVGWSQPVVWGDKVFVTAAESDDQAKPNPSQMGPGVGLTGFLTGMKPPDVNVRWKVLCLDAATGNVLWEKTARESRPPVHIHPNNTYASETPVVDAERVIADFGMAGVYCYDHAGNLLWNKDLGVYPIQFGWGTASSPLLVGDAAYIQCDNDQASFLAALNVKTGDVLWRVPRDELSNWSTPYLWTNKLRTELVTAGGQAMRSYDPRSGELLWEYTAQGRTATTPTGNEELLFVDSYDRLTGTTGVLSALRAGASGKVALEPGKQSNDIVAWSLPITGNRMASPLVYQDCLYVLEQRGGIVRCLDAATGKEHYRRRAQGASGFVASPVAADGRVYCVDQDGRTTVLEAGPKFKLISSNELGEMCWATAAVAGNRLLIRTVDHLYCVGE